MDYSAAQRFALRDAFVVRSFGRESLRRLNRKPEGRCGGGPGSQARNRLSSQTVTRSSTRRCCPRRAFPFRSRSPVKSPKQIAEMLLREVMPDSRWAPHKTEVKQSD